LVRLGDGNKLAALRQVVQNDKIADGRNSQRCGRDAESKARKQAIKQKPKSMNTRTQRKQKKLPTRQPLHMNRKSDYVPGALVFMDVELIFITVASTRAQTVDCNLLSAVSHFTIEVSVFSTISHA
jgi:hypothetical protein